MYCSIHLSMIVCTCGLSCIIMHMDFMSSFVGLVRIWKNLLKKRKSFSVFYNSHLVMALQVIIIEKNGVFKPSEMVSRSILLFSASESYGFSSHLPETFKGSAQYFGCSQQYAPLDRSLMYLESGGATYPAHRFLVLLFFLLDIISLRIVISVILIFVFFYKKGIMSSPLCKRIICNLESTTRGMGEVEKLSFYIVS